MKSMRDEMRAAERFDRDWHDGKVKKGTAMNIDNETSNDFDRAALHLRKAANILDHIASQDPDAYARFEARLRDAGLEQIVRLIEPVRDECDLISSILDHEFNAAIDRDNAAIDARENALDMARKDGGLRRLDAAE